MKKKRIQFISIVAVNGTVYDDQGDMDYNTVFTPYAIGLLHAALNADDEIVSQYEICPDYIFDNKRTIEDYMSDINFDCDIFAFSTYLWNEQRHLKIAKTIKEKKPTACVIFGGQNIPIVANKHSEDFLLKNRQIDILVHGQGELIFIDILKNLDKLNIVNNISFINNNAVITTQQIKIKAQDLKKEVSPYYPRFLFQNMFQKIESENRYLTFLMETNRGCPYECVFCEWGKYVGNSLVKINDIDFIKKEIETIMLNIKHSKFSRGIFIIDSNFGIIKRDIEIIESIIANKKKHNIEQVFLFKCDSKKVTSHSLEIEKIIQKENIFSIKILAMQTSDLSTLNNIKRPYVDKKEMIITRNENDTKGVNAIEFIFSLPGGYSYQKYLTDLDYLLDTYPYGYYQAYICFASINTEIRNPEYMEKWRIETETFPIFDKYKNVELNRCVVATNSFSRQDFAKMFKMNIIWKLLKNNKPFNIMNNIIVYLHKNKILSFSLLIEKFYQYITENRTYIYKQNRHVFKYIDMLASGYYTRHEEKKIKRKFFAKLCTKNFKLYHEDIVNFINATFDDNKLKEKLLKILKITLILIRAKKNTVIDSAGWELYGLHGLYYLNVTRVDLKKIIVVN